jgi:predicted metalloprotease with PDZ domain
MQAVDGRENTFREPSYHALADMPLFIGRFDVDSVVRGDSWDRLATYPSRTLTGEARAALNKQIGDMIAVQSAVFGETPFASYTTLIMFDDSALGGRSLGHRNSLVGIYHPTFIGNPILSLTAAHGIFHAWHGKRLVPEDLADTRYDAVPSTSWLWLLEGVTGYYADLTLTRAGIVSPEVFANITESKLYRVDLAPPVALEDASLSAAIQPVDGTAPLYGEKGSLAGFLLDILIRDASDNRGSLDTALRELYASTWKRGRGFTPADWWRAVERAADGASFDEFHDRFIDGRDPFPFADVLPRAGFAFIADTTREPRIGVQTRSDDDGVRVVLVQPGSMAAEAGIRVGDYLLAVGDVAIDDASFAARFRQRYARADAGARLGITVRRAGEPMSLQAGLSFAERVENRIALDPEARGKPLRIRDAILFDR